MFQIDTLNFTCILQFASCTFSNLHAANLPALEALSVHSVPAPYSNL